MSKLISVIPPSDKIDLEELEKKKEEIKQIKIQRNYYEQELIKSRKRIEKIE